MKETTSQQDWKHFINWEIASKDTIDFKKVYVDIADDLVAGLVLSQIVYWHLPSDNSSTKLRVKHEGKLWLAKRHQDWYDEIRITVRQAKRALKILEGKEIIETALYKFNGAPTKHIRIKRNVFLKKIASNLDNYWINTKRPNGKAQNVLMESNETCDSLTENTTKNISSSSSSLRTCNDIRMKSGQKNPKPQKRMMMIKRKKRKDKRQFS